MTAVRAAAPPGPRGEPGPAPPASPVVLVVGLGNVLMGDDGFGPYVARLLESRYTCPDRVSILDLGTPGLDLIPHLTGIDVLILVDTVRSDGPPGSLRLYDRAALLRHPPQQRTRPHDPGVEETLLALDLAGGGPSEVLLVGVIPGPVKSGVGLTPVLRAAVPRAVRAVLRELGRRGRPLRRRPVPLPADIWWEAGERSVPCTR